jgi:hypothetical protein
MEIGGTEIADQLVRRGSSHSHIGLEPAFGISTKVSRGTIRDWTSSTGSSLMNKGRLRALLKEPLLKELYYYLI